MKKKNRRSKTKFPALQKNLNLKTRQELVDMDYLHKLSDEEKDWYNRFLEEYNNANFNHGGEVLHKTDEQRKDCYNRNNARNRCIFTTSKASGQLDYMAETEALGIKKKKVD